PALRRNPELLASQYLGRTCNLDLEKAGGTLYVLAKSAKARCVLRPVIPALDISPGIERVVELRAEQVETFEVLSDGSIACLSRPRLGSSHCIFVQNRGDYFAPPIVLGDRPDGARISWAAADDSGRLLAGDYDRFWLYASEGRVIRQFDIADV